jgi:uncharacterized membrane-anchored protein
MGTEGLIQLLIYLLIGGVIIYVVYWILGMLTLPQPAKQAILVVLAIIVLLWLLRTFGLL